MAIQFTNDASTFLAANISAAATSITVVDASSFPALGATDHTYITLSTPDNSAKEIVKCTAISGTTLTVIRAQEGTTAQSFTTSDRAQIRITAQLFRDVMAAFASLDTFKYTATAGQTTFSGSDTNAATLTYTLNNIIVILNGISLDASDFTATSGTSIVLATGAAADDELVVVAFKSFTLADHYDKTASDAKYRTLTGDQSHGDNVKAKFGNSDDLVIYHDNAVPATYIKESGSGDLKISGNNLWLNDATGNTYFRAVNNSYAKMYHAGYEKLATTSSGVDISGDIHLTDPNPQILMTDSNTSATFNVTLDGVSTNITNAGTNGEVAFHTFNGEKLRLKSGGIDVTGTVTADGLTLGSNHRIQGTGGLFLGGSSATVFEVGAGTEKMRLTSTGLGIGTSSPSAPLHTVSSSTTIARFEGSNAGNLYITNDSAHVMTLQGSTSTALAFNTGGGNERLRIDSSGNVLVGKTDASIAVEGTFIGGGSNNGTVEITRDQNRPLRLNRTTDDGTILELLKNGSQVGSIGTTGGEMYIGSGDCALRFNDGGDQIRVSTSTGSNRDGAIDLGFTDSRFKDGHFSGTVNAGGLVVNAGASNVVATFESTDSVGAIELKDSSGTCELSTSNSGFSVQPNGGASVLTVDSSGNMDISGTTGQISSASTDEGAVLRLSNKKSFENGYDGNAFVGGIEFYTQDSSEGGPQVFGAIKQRQLNYYNNQAMCFFTSTYNGSLTERMRIDSSGNVGIGSSSPTSFSNYTTLGLDASSGGLIEIMVGGTRTANIQASSTETHIQTRTNTPLIFDTNSTERMRIDSAGRMMLGQTWPYAPTGGGFTPLTLTGSGNSRTDLVVSNQTNGADSGAAVVLGAYGADHIIEGQSAAQGGALTFTKSGSERLRIDSSGNSIFGGGSLYGSNTVSITAASGIDQRWQSGVAHSNLQNAISGVSNGFQTEQDSSNNLTYTFHTGANAVGLKLDSSGNLGIGVTPESWHTGYNALQIGGRGFLAAHTGSDCYLGQNAYYNNGWKYIDTGNAASFIQQSGGLIQHFVAPSGTADSAISWTTAMTIDNSGRVIMGTSTTGNHPSWFGSGTRTGLCIQGGGGGPHVLYLKNNDTSGGANMIQFVDGSGDICGAINSNATSNTTSYSTTSDYRAKENVTPMTNASERLMQLKPSNFNFITDPETLWDGFLAHEAQAVVPESVVGDKDAMRDEEYEVTPAIEATFDDEGEELTAAVDAVMGTRSVPDMQGIDQSKLVPLLTAALQEALARIEALENK